MTAFIHEFMVVKDLCVCLQMFFLRAKLHNNDYNTDKKRNSKWLARHQVIMHLRRSRRVA